MLELRLWGRKGERIKVTPGLKRPAGSKSFCFVLVYMGHIVTLPVFTTCLTCLPKQEGRAFIYVKNNYWFNMCSGFWATIR